MKKLPLLVLASSLIVLAATGCAHVHVRPAANPSGPDYAAAQGLRSRDRSEDLRNLNTPELKQRSDALERRGYSAEDARAFAQAEYLKSGR